MATLTDYEAQLHAAILTVLKDANTPLPAYDIRARVQDVMHAFAEDITAEIIHMFMAGEIARIVPKAKRAVYTYYIEPKGAQP